MIIDAHVKPDAIALNKLLFDMDENEIEKAWILGWECPQNEFDCILWDDFPDGGPIPWDISRSYYKQNPNRFILGYAPDFRRPEAYDLIRVGISFYNIKVYGEVKLRTCYDNYDALRIFRYCGENGVPVVLHYTYEYQTGRAFPRDSWWYGGDVFSLMRLLALCPETNFAVGGPGFWHHFKEDENQALSPYDKTGKGILVQSMLEKYPNLYCDTSFEAYEALAQNRELLKKFLENYSDRVLFGRGSPDNKLFELINALSLSEKASDNFYYKNAQKLVNS